MRSWHVPSGDGIDQCHRTRLMAATVPCGYLSSRPLSDMPSTPAALDSPLTPAEGSGVRNDGLGLTVHG